MRAMNVRASIQDSAALRTAHGGAISDSLHPANKPKDESDENNGSEEAANVHRNLLAVTFDVIRA
jgi:hypothetical protein